ncbi:glycosyltransferase family 4 protein [Actinomycetaceae bacterium WB03_NA08]|uniref:Glycosyltransferase family 4 protein n=1 Tax=Scrofimicrobium canadense TaxID=2652290 RepID=A0A6N7WAB2_9ACTO|nr:hypothetical protein [Scrofimicrobium canadense]MSS85413.1 glycosyltransferase family 4 protein [Scrofimicrobium canadense]
MLAGKRFLITQPTVAWINGSTVATFELSKYLQESGAQVTVFTWVLDSPARDLFADSGIDVLTPRMRSVSVEDFDYVWVHSQVLPQEVLEELPGAKELPMFIYLHMSSLAECADERPFVFGIEESIASLSLFISQRVKDAQAPYFSSGYAGGFYCNPAPDAFAQIEARASGEAPQRALVVSNHPPIEVVDAMRILEDSGCQVVFFGESGDEYRLVTPEVISEYDLVVTIGKTVQYCLVSGTPVYIYDHFGGPGYLNADNYEDAAYSHFSGRDSESRSASELFEDIIGRYCEAAKYQRERLTDFRTIYTISSVFLDILQSLTERSLEPPEARVLHAASSALLVAQQRFQSQYEANTLASGLRKESTRLADAEEQLRQAWSDNVLLQGQIESLQDELTAITDSRRWRYVSKVARISDSLRQLLGRR